MLTKNIWNFFITTHVTGLILYSCEISAFTFDFIDNFKSKINAGYIDSNNGYYNILNAYEMNFNHSDIFGNNVLNVTDFTIISILKFKYDDEDDDGINIFGLKIDSIPLSIAYYIRREENKVFITISKNWLSDDISFKISNDQMLANNEWHKIILEFTKGAYRLWVDCEYIGESRAENNKYKFLDFNETRNTEIELNTRRLFYQSANFQMKQLQLISGEDNQYINKTDCSDVPASLQHFKLNVLEQLNNKSSPSIYEFENSVQLGDKLREFHKNPNKYNFDSENFSVYYKIRLPTTSIADKSYNLLDGKWHKLLYTAKSDGEIRIYLDCKFIGNYSLYNIRKNLVFNSSYSAVDTIFQLGLQDLKIELKTLTIQNGKSFEETLKDICPNFIETKDETLIKCSDLKKPFENLNCDGKTIENWNFNTLETIKEVTNKHSSSVGDVFTFDGLTSFGDVLRQSNWNLFAPNFDKDNYYAEYILRLKHPDHSIETEDSIFDAKWHKLSSLMVNNSIIVYFDCEIQLAFDLSQGGNEVLTDILQGNLNFGTSKIVSIIPFFGRLDGYMLEILKFTIYSPSAQIESTDCKDLKEIIEKFKI